MVPISVNQLHITQAMAEAPSEELYAEVELSDPGLDDSAVGEEAQGIQVIRLGIP